jgi:hypothetical protein
MTDLAKKEEAVIAHKNYEDTVVLKGAIARDFVTLGRLLKECLDNSYWKILGHDSFEAYVATPEIALSRSYAYQVVKLFKVYVEDMGLSEGDLTRIGPSRLIAMLPWATDWRGENGGDLMSDAEHLSLSDLSEKYGRGGGHSKGVAADHGGAERLAPSGLSLDEWKLRSGCAVCGDACVEKDHFPRTQGAGADDDDWIPLCRTHHQEHHDKGVDTFLVENKFNIFKWFYYRLDAAWNRGDK